MSNKSPFAELVSMHARDPNESHRGATPLELFYDLVSVVAIASAASLLHHGFSNNHIAEAVGLFLVTFWMIWWAWMSFTWFATGYDKDTKLCLRLLKFNFTENLYFGRYIENSYNF